MPKVLFCASSLSHIQRFHLPYLKYFLDRGFEVHAALPGRETPEYARVLHSVPMEKSLLSPRNLRAVFLLREILHNERFDLILTHTALAGAVGRLALALAGKGSTKIVHTVHGYLFWQGCGSVKALQYRLPEQMLRGVTDCLITMNAEDTAAARFLVRKGGLLFQVPGMGADTARFRPASQDTRRSTREALSLSDESYVLVYPAEFSRRKNHMELLRAMARIVREAPQAVLLLCGQGDTQAEMRREAEHLGIREAVRFLGFQERMEEIYPACDIAVTSSISEGLPFNVIEAQLCGLPVAASRIRGHTDLIRDGENGRLYSPGDPEALARTVLEVFRSPDQGAGLGRRALESAPAFSLERAFQANTAAYEAVLGL